MSRVNLLQLRVCLAELASLEFQERTWFSEKGPEVSSFSEQVSQLFDDTGLSDVLDGKTLEDEVGPDAALALRELDAAIGRVEKSLAPAELIAHPSMERVRLVARKALNEMEKVHS